VSAEEAHALERIEGKIDFLIERQHQHDLRFVPLEADYTQRQDQKKSRARVVYGVVTAFLAAVVLAFFGFHK
jgi:hypothetical protein